MKSPIKPRAGERAPVPEQDRTRNTPAADMQPEDAGTAESGNDAAPRQGGAAGKAMKQASKTDAQSGERRH